MPRAVIAIGGNSLIRDSAHQTVEDQYDAAAETTSHLANLVDAGWEFAIVHGNGPQVGFILRRSELSAHELHEIPLDVCGADTQGALGYALQQTLQNHLLEIGISKPVATVVTQVEVDPTDPAFANPTKPIGSFMEEERARQREEEHGWFCVEDAGRGWRRCVASPIPQRIVELASIATLLDAGAIVVAVGGGGIPVVADGEGRLRGVAAVIDKDRAAALLAKGIGADVMVISTAVEKVALHFGTADEEDIDEMTLTAAKQYLEEGVHFKEGSMAPKIEAAIDFLESGGDAVIISDPAHLEDAVAGKTGTHIVP